MRRFHKIIEHFGDAPGVELKRKRMPGTVITHSGNGHRGEHEAHFFYPDDRSAFPPDFHAHRKSTRRYYEYERPWPTRRDVINIGCRFGWSWHSPVHSNGRLMRCMITRFSFVIMPVFCLLSGIPPIPGSTFLIRHRTANETIGGNNMDEPREIILLSRAHQALTEAQTLDEVKDLRDKAVAVRAYAKKARAWQGSRR